MLKLTAAAAAVSLATGAAVFAMNGYVMTPEIAGGIFAVALGAVRAVQTTCASR